MLNSFLNLSISTLMYVCMPVVLQFNSLPLGIYNHTNIHAYMGLNVELQYIIHSYRKEEDCNTLILNFVCSFHSFLIHTLAVNFK